MSAPLNDPAVGQENTGTPAPDASPAEGGQGSGINPIYQSALDSANVPQEFRGKLVEQFQNWDRNHQAQLDEWKPFQEFKGLNPQEIRLAREFYDKVNSDPVAVHDRLQQVLIQSGRLPDPSFARQNQQQVQPQQFQQPTYGQPQGGIDYDQFAQPGNAQQQIGQLQNLQQQMPANDPRLDAISEKIEALQQFAQWQYTNQQQTQAQQQQQEIENRLIQDLTKVQQTYGLAPEQMEQVIERMGIANNAGTPISAEQAAQQIQTYNDQVIANYLQGRRVAPMVSNSNGGGIPKEATKRVEDMNDEERRDYGAWIARTHAGG
jgi:hypothetical protein